MSQFKVIGISLAVLALLALPVLAFAANPAQTSPLTITLNPENNSGESGTATLTDMGNNQVKVDVTITGEPSGASQPMHIHTGQCGPTLGGVAFPLTPLVDGKSTTTVNVALATLMDGNHAINGHKSAQEINTYVYCGNIPAAAGAAATTTEAATAAPTAAAATTEVAATPTTAPVGAAATPTTPPSSLPTTGGSESNTLPLVALIVALVAFGAGLVIRRSVKS